MYLCLAIKCLKILFIFVNPRCLLNPLICHAMSCNVFENKCNRFPMLCRRQTNRKRKYMYILRKRISAAYFFFNFGTLNCRLYTSNCRKELENYTVHVKMILHFALLTKLIDVTVGETASKCFILKSPSQFHKGTDFNCVIW